MKNPQTLRARSPVRWPGRLRPVAALAAALAQLLVTHAGAAPVPVICDQLFYPAPVNAGEILFLDTSDVCLTEGAWIIESTGVVTIGSATRPVVFINGSNVLDGSVTFSASVINRGRINATAGSTFANTVSLANEGLFDNAGQFTVTGLNGFVDNSGSFTNSGTLTIDAAIDSTRVSFANRHALTNTGSIHNAATWLNDIGATLQLVGPTAILNNTYILDNRGTLTVDTGSVFDSTDGSIINGNNATLINNGRLSSAGWTNVNDGIWRNHGVMQLFTTLVSNKTFENSGTAADLQLSGGSLWVYGDLTNSALISIGDGSLYLLENSVFTSTGTVTAGPGALLLTLGRVQVIGGSFDIDGRFEVQAGGIFDSAGQFVLRGELQNTGTMLFSGVQTFESTASLQNFSSMTLGGTTSLVGGGRVENYGELRVAAGGTVSNDSGLLNWSTGTFTVAGAVTSTNSMNNLGIVTIAAGGSMIEGGLAFNSGIFTVAERASYTGLGYFGNLGMFSVEQGGSFVLGGTFDNAAGAELTLGGRYDFTGGTLNNGGLLRVSVPFTFGAPASGTVTLLEGSSFVAEATSAIASGYTLVNMGSMTVQTMSIDGTLDNRGTFEGRSVRVVGRFNNSGAVAVADKTTFTSLGYAGNSGDFSVHQGGNFVLGGTFDNAAGAQLTVAGKYDFSGGTLNNSGLLRVMVPFTFGAPASGTVALLEGGSFVADATIAVLPRYTLLNQGSMVVQDMSIDGTLENRGTFEGGQIRISGRFLNLGRATVVGLENDEGELTNFNNATLTLSGNLVNRGGINNTRLGTIRFESPLDNQYFIFNSGDIAFTGAVNNGTFGNITARRQSVTDFAQISNAGSLLFETGSLVRVQLELRNTGQVSNSGELRVGNDLHNTGQMTNLGEVHIGRKLTNGAAGLPVGQVEFINRGQLLIGAGATLENFATILGFGTSGTLSNAGNVANAGRIVNTSVVNSGALLNLGELSLGSLHNADVFTNSGVTSAEGFTNSGSTSNNGSFVTSFATNSGRLRNEAGGSLSIQTFDNTGTFDNAGNTVAVSGSSSSTLLNSGTFVAGRLTPPGTILPLLQLSGQVFNSGQFENLSKVELASSAVFDNQSGVIVNRLLWTQSGLISGGEVHNLGGTWSALGALDVASVRNTAILDVDGSARASTITNGGVLIISGSLNAATVQNDGGLFGATGGTLAVTTLNNTANVRISQVESLAILNLTNSGMVSIETSAGRVETTSNRGHASLADIAIGDWDNADSGSVRAGPIRIDHRFTNSGRARFDGEVSGNGTYVQSLGTTTINADFLLPLVQINGGAVCGTGRIRGALVVSGGKVCPGLSPGTLTVDGRFELSGGIIELEIAGTAAGSYDQLVLNGDTSFSAGVLRITFIDGYLPQPGDTWQLVVQTLQLGGLATLATEVSGLPADAVYAFDISIGGLGVSVSAVPEPAPWLLWAAAMPVLGVFGRQHRQRQRAQA